MTTIIFDKKSNDFFDILRRAYVAFKWLPSSFTEKERVVRNRFSFSMWRLLQQTDSSFKVKILKLLHYAFFIIPNQRSFKDKRFCLYLNIKESQETKNKFYVRILADFSWQVNHDWCSNELKFVGLVDVCIERKSLYESYFSININKNFKRNHRQLLKELICLRRTLWRRWKHDDRWENFQSRKTAFFKIFEPFLCRERKTRTLPDFKSVVDFVDKLIVNFTAF